MDLKKISTCMAAMVMIVSVANAGTVDEGLTALKENLGKQLIAKGRKKVAALDFTNLQGRPSELGRYLAEQLTVEMVSAEGITVVDRANLKSILDEHKLTEEGLVNPENAKKLGQFAGVDAILIGNVATLDNMVVLTVKGISTDTAEVVAAGRMKFDVTKDVQRMLGMSVGGGEAKAAGGSSATAADPVAIATIEVGPITAVARNVSLSFLEQNDGSKLPSIRITFDLENRNLNTRAAVSANCLVTDDARNSVYAPRVTAIAGTMADASQRRWSIPKGGLRGVPTVFCFETIDSGAGASAQTYVTQNAPSNVVEYIKRATKYDGSESLKNKTQKLWSGGFASIEPGKTSEMVVSFIPADSIEGNGRRHREQNDQFAWPEWVELSVELVVATHSDGEEPDKAKDLALRNLNIGRLVLPKPDAKAGK